MSTRRSSTKRKAQDTEDSASKSDVQKKRKTSSDEEAFNMNRMRILTKQTSIAKKYQGIVYWMWRDQRVQGIKTIQYYNFMESKLRFLII